MPTPKKGETREQMNERLRAKPKVAKPAPIVTPEGLPLAAFSWKKARWAPSSQSVYDVTWRAFVAFCAKEGVITFPAPADSVARFLTASAEGHSTSWVSVALTSIRAAHKDVKGGLPKTDTSREFYVLDDPVIVDAWKDIAHTKGTAKTPKAAIVTADIKRIVKAIPPHKLLDRAVLLLGFASAMRRSEIVALNRDDLEFSEEGLAITIRRSKTDKAGKGQQVAILRSDTDYCAVKAVERWLEHMDITEGAVFRNTRDHRLAAPDVAATVKRWAAKAGFDPRLVAAHSLRRGCITSMFKAGTDIKNVMAHSRHTTVDIAFGYVEADRAMKNPGLKNLGL